MTEQDIKAIKELSTYVFDNPELKTYERSVEVVQDPEYYDEEFEQDYKEYVEKVISNYINTNKVFPLFYTQIDLCNDEEQIIYGTVTIVNYKLRISEYKVLEIIVDVDLSLN